MSSTNAASRVAIVATLALIVLAACTPAQQGGQGPTSSPAVTGQVSNGPQHDPNFPSSFSAQAVANMPIYWSAGNQTKPAVHFKNPPADMEYLGFDDKGSLIRNEGTGKVYRWNFKENSLTVVANNFKEIPLDELASLKNTPQTVQYYLAQNGRGPKPSTVPQQQAPQHPDKSAGLSSDNLQKTLQNVAPAAGSPFEISGKNASVKDGVLTFILPDATKSKPYTVVRPGFMANAPQSAGIAGTWIAKEAEGKGILFTIQADNTVTAKEISSQVVQMLLQGGGKK